MLISIHLLVPILVWLLLMLVAHSAFAGACLGLVVLMFSPLLICTSMGFILGFPASHLCLYQIYG
jgi:hypothetical protein